MNWIKKNKLAAVLIVILLFLLFKGFLSSFFGLNVARMPAYEVSPGFGDIAGAPSLSYKRGIIPQPEYPPSEREERLVVEESSMSLVVSKVQETVEMVVERAKQVGGFMVSSSLTHPEEAPFATVVVRVPADRFRETLSFFRTLAVKVSSENILGTDVTDEYVDIEARLATLEKTKAKFESIMDQATTVDQTLNVQRELINLQDQIDALKGRRKYLEQTAKLAKITVYLSSDELALPYVPAKPFRPTVIFKMAVRSLVGTLRKFITLLVWVGVYSVIWLPIVIIVFFIKKRRKKKLVGVV